MGLTTGLKIFGILGIILAVGGGVLYLMNLKADFEITKKNNEILTESIQKQTEVIENMQAEISLIQKLSLEIQQTAHTQQREMNNLQKRFNERSNGESRDFGVIAKAKPKLVEKIVNKAAQNVNRCFEIITGSPLKEKETNRECQKFIDGLAAN